MKKVVVLLMALLPFAAMAQGGFFTLNGKIAGLDKPSKIYLLYQQAGARLLDSSVVEGGNFSFKGTVTFPVQATLIVDKANQGIAQLDTSADHLGFYLEKGEINVTAANKLAKATISGSKINDDNKRLEAKVAVIQNKAKALAAEINAAPAEKRNAPDYQSSMQGKFKALQSEMEATLAAFIKENPNSYLSLMALSSLGGPSADARVIEPLFNGLSNELKSTDAAIQLKLSLDKLRITGIGAVAPDFTQNDITGKPIKLSSFKGMYVLVDFWASWCGPCRQENPNVVNAYNKYKKKNFTILGVSLDKDKTAWINAIKKDGLSWFQVSDLQYWNNQAAGLYYVSSIPQNFLIGPDGKIIAKNLRGEDLERKLAELFGKI